MYCSAIAAVPFRSWTKATRSASFSSVSTIEACEMLVIPGLIVELLQQREHHMRLETFDLVAHRLDFLLHAERANFMASRTQGVHDVEFGFPFVDFPRGVSVGGF